MQHFIAKARGKHECFVEYFCTTKNLCFFSSMIIILPPGLVSYTCWTTYMFFFLTIQVSCNKRTSKSIDKATQKYRHNTEKLWVRTNKNFFHNRMVNSFFSEKVLIHSLSFTFMQYQHTVQCVFCSSSKMLFFLCNCKNCVIWLLYE